MSGDTAPAIPQWPVHHLSSAVFAQRNGEILLLKRAGGEMTGGWYLPGGALDTGETIEQCAARELHEEAGLVPTGPLICVAVAHMHVYGADSLQVLYAADCDEGDVILSHEHSAFRWMNPTAYRDRYFTDDILKNATAADPRIGDMLTDIRNALDAYLAWRAGRV